MLSQAKYLSLNLLARSLHRSFGTKPNRRRRYGGSRITDQDEEEDERKQRKKLKEEEGHLYLHKSRGQHLLTNPRVLDAIVRKADIRPTDTILEIGPGTGNLTLRLLQAAQKVTAVEIDKRMIEILSNRVAERGFQEDKITVISKDALKTEFPPFDLVVANIPYGISSPLIAKLVFGNYPFRSATLLLQKEFARRLLANPGDSEFNRLAVNVKLVADVEFIMDVSKRDFVPCPRVDSSVVKIRPKAHIPDVDLNEWWAFTRTCFSKKNKTLGATFKQKKKVVELLTRSEKMIQHKDIVVSDDHHIYKENDEGKEEQDDEDDDDQEEEEEESDVGDLASVCSGTEMSLYRDKIVGILKAGGFEDKRPSKMSNEEFLCLLSLFNQSGIHFHDQTKGKVDPNVALAASYSI